MNTPQTPSESAIQIGKIVISIIPTIRTFSYIFIPIRNSRFSSDSHFFVLFRTFSCTNGRQTLTSAAVECCGLKGGRGGRGTNKGCPCAAVQSKIESEIAKLSLKIAKLKHRVACREQSCHRRTRCAIPLPRLHCAQTVQALPVCVGWLVPSFCLVRERHHAVFVFFALYSHFNVRTGTQPSIRVMRIDKCAWPSLALCEGCSHGGTSELTLSWMGRVAEN